MAEMSAQRKVELVTKDRTYVTSIKFLANKNKINHTGNQRRPYEMV